MFGLRLRVLREEHGMLQKDVATLLKTSVSTIGMYERGQRDPDTATVRFLAEHFSVSTDWLLGITDDSRPISQIISDAVSDAPELANFWDKLKEREDLQLLFKQTKDLSPEAIKKIIRIIKAIEDEESQED